MKPKWRFEGKKILILDFGEKRFLVAILNTLDGWIWGTVTTAAAQRGQMACQERVKTQGTVMMTSPQRAFREQTDMLGILGATAVNI